MPGIPKDSFEEDDDDEFKTEDAKSANQEMIILLLLLYKSRVLYPMVVSDFRHFEFKV